VVDVAVYVTNGVISVNRNKDARIATAAPVAYAGEALNVDVQPADENHALPAEGVGCHVCKMSAIVGAIITPAFVGGAVASTVGTVTAGTIADGDDGGVVVNG
tara:strand:+ start:150 stop:458 length:309 start_codon:yes stop_codon:yes gene_type:complete